MTGQWDRGIFTDFLCLMMIDSCVYMKKILPLLKDVQAISSCRDRNNLLPIFLNVIDSLFESDIELGICYRDFQSNMTFRTHSGIQIRNLDSTEWEKLITLAVIKGDIEFGSIGGRYCGALLLHSSEIALAQTILIFDAGKNKIADYVNILTTLANIYGNQVKMLDYAELDVLTRLLNRKTFEVTFDRLLSAPAEESLDQSFRERRVPLDDGSQAWLCIIDIDFFKRINDEFGHLFGDEVLLRMGDLMRNSFRDGDRLFRFGGEEFVVIINAANSTLAEIGFNRFRACVENHEFPRVGKVTCSIGFTGISRLDVPTDAVGRADEALYYAKQHGRNQVAFYENLVSFGMISPAAYTRTNMIEGLNIDEFFDLQKALSVKSTKPDETVS